MVRTAVSKRRSPSSGSLHSSWQRKKEIHKLFIKKIISRCDKCCKESKTGQMGKSGPDLHDQGRPLCRGNI